MKSNHFSSVAVLASIAGAVLFSGVLCQKQESMKADMAQSVTMDSTGQSVSGDIDTTTLRPAGPEGDYYSCAEHPQIRLKDPGSCPICGKNMRVRNKDMYGGCP